jgi:hypothetical protein
MFDAMLVTKYMFVFHLRNPSAVTEDFWDQFLQKLEPIRRLLDLQPKRLRCT